MASCLPPCRSENSGIPGDQRIKDCSDNSGSGYGLRILPETTSLLYLRFQSATFASPSYRFPVSGERSMTKRKGKGDVSEEAR
ncbi:hypothetical protein GUJ93_ZPchr0006g42037 [Zizania palustris]|uniref:Uncharacterized protein n=1 Tax=Zizania palustris TaxID=103762 RepID=A0A8J5S927_ZIZPA|nr:hypothetical protein GUJ93_ZPchr0006g42037 [Zizania palustris]